MYKSHSQQENHLYPMMNELYPKLEPRKIINEKIMESR